MDDPSAQGQLLERYIEVSDWERAAPIAHDLIAAEPDQSRWHRAAGQCALHLDRPDDASDHLHVALGISADDHLAHYFLSHALRLQKRPADAEAAVERAIQLQPEDADYWTEFGWLAFERDDHSAALRCANTACELNPENPRATTLLAAAQSQIPPDEGGTRGEPHAQIASLGRTLEIDPENDAALHNMGVVYFNELRDHRAAEHHFRQALAIAPTEALYERHLERSLRHQDGVLRALYAPWNLAASAIDLVAGGWERRWPLVVALPLLPLLLAAALLLTLFWAIFLWPPAALYQLLTRPDTMPDRLTPSSRPKRPRRWSRTGRLALFVAGFTAFWLVLIQLFKTLAFRAEIATVLTALVAAWLGLAAYACAREFLGSRERRARGRAIDLLDR